VHLSCWGISWRARVDDEHAGLCARENECGAQSGGAGADDDDVMVTTSTSTVPPVSSIPGELSPKLGQADSIAG